MKCTRSHLVLLILFFISTAAAIFISGCSDSTGPKDGQGQIKIMMVDSPADYDEVNIVVTRVEVHLSGYDDNSGWFVINNNVATYDLLLLRNGASVILGDNYLNAGHYTQIRLIIGEGSNVVVNGVVYPLEIPSGEQTGLKLNHEFDIIAETVYELMLDFDAERSIILTGNGQYKLKPVIRLIPVIISGTISGMINPATAAYLVYAISGTDTVITLAEPIFGSFRLMALAQSTYNVIILSGIPAYNDLTINNVSVIANQNTDLGTINLSLK